MKKTFRGRVAELNKEIRQRIAYKDENGVPSIANFKGIYATDAEVRALRQLAITMDHVFGLFPMVDLGDDDETLR